MTRDMTGIARRSGGRRLRASLLAPAAAATLILGVAVTTAPAQAATSAAQAVSGVTVPVSGSNFTGTLDVTRFVTQGSKLLAVGTLSGAVTGAAGTVIGTVTGVPVSVPVTQAAGTCQILHLDLGPLDLTLLGLHVHLNEVVLDITAQQGGGLLGNLLCAVANLLNGGAPLGSLAGLLNQILAVL